MATSINRAYAAGLRAGSTEPGKFEHNHASFWRGIACVIPLMLLHEGNYNCDVCEEREADDSLECAGCGKRFCADCYEDEMNGADCPECERVWRRKQ